MIGPGKGAEVKFRNGSMSTQGVGFGKFYTLGHYDYATADSNLTQAAPTQTHGQTNEPSGVHASIVAGGPGSASGGVGLVEIEVSGTSITELGVNTPGDTEVLVADITAMALDQYFETTKKWNGTVTYTLKNATGSTQTTFNADFNYGHCKYTDMSDRKFLIKELKIGGLAGNNDSAFNVRLLKHSPIGWTYATTGFVPGDGSIVDMATDYGADTVLSNTHNFNWDRAGISEIVDGSGNEGFIVEITTGQPNSIQSLDADVGVLFL